MTARTSPWLLTALAWGCLPAHDQPTLPLSEDARLELRDAHGSLWPSQAMPRSPRLRLWFDTPVASASTVRAWLLEGPANADTLADLSAHDADGIRERTASRLVPLVVTQTSRYADAAPTLPLSAERDYSLVFAAATGLVVRALHTSGAPGAGAALVATSPSAGAGRVPRAQADLLWLFDGDVSASGRARLSANGVDTFPALDGVGCALRGFAPARCLSASLTAPLAPAADYTAHFDGEVFDATGAQLSVPPIPFTSVRADGEEPLALSAPRCGAGEVAQGPCCLRASGDALRVRAESSEPLSACLVGCGGAACAPSAAAELRVSLTRSEPRPCPAVLRVVDGARRTLDVPLAVAAADDVATFAVTELRPPASGEGSTRSYVELLNFGSAPGTLQGATLLIGTESHAVTLDDDSPVDPGERVLVVSSDFVPGAEPATEGPVPAPDVRLIRLTRPLPLSASGSAVALLDAAGRYVSGAPALPAPFPGACAVRRGDALRSDAPEAFSLRAPADCSPGRAEP